MNKFRVFRDCTNIDFSIYQSTSANMDGKEVSTSSTLVSGAFESSSINISCSSLPTNDDDGNTLYYQIEVTNTNENVNGKTIVTALSSVFGGKVVAISAEYIGDYVITEETSIVPPDLSPNLFKITKTYSDGSTALETSADLTNYKLDSSVTS